MISVVIPTKDRNEMLQKTIEQAKTAILPFDGEIIIVNDSKNQVLIPDTLKQDIILVNNPKQGVASARNYGASKARGEWLLFMDDDMLINSSNIREVVSLIQDYPQACFNINWEYPTALQKKLKQTQFGRFLEYYGFTTYKGWNKNAAWSDDAVFETQSITEPVFLHQKSRFFSCGRI